AAATPRVDELSDVGIARSDDAIVRRNHPLESGQLAQAGDVGARRLDLSIARLSCARLLVRFLARDRIDCLQAAPALGGKVGDLLVGLGYGEIRLGLAQLLIHLRSLDVAEDLALADLRADIDIPVAQ